MVPVGAPFPDVAGHVEQAEAVGREGSHGGRARKTVLAGVLTRKGALPGVGQELAGRVLFISPAEPLPVQAAASRELPFGLAREALVGPFAICQCVVVG